MAKKSGTAGSAVLPTAPDLAEDADVADPGEMSRIKAEQVEQQKGKYGSTPAKPHKPPQDEEDAEEEGKTSWIEIELVGEDDEPISGEKYKITLPDDSIATGTLDGNGSARVEGFEKGTCKVSFPDLDKEAWEKI
jgi:hypothetical protein